jgi:hypothetical protein
MEATAMFADMARDIARDLSKNLKWQIEVADESRKPIFRLNVVAKALQ